MLEATRRSRRNGNIDGATGSRVRGTGANGHALVLATLECWTTIDGRHRVLLDRHGKLAACGSDTWQFLAKSQDFRVHAGQFQPADSRHSAKFERLYLTTCAEVRSEIFPMKNGDGHWICQAAPVNAIGAEPLIGLTIQLASEKHRPEWADLREALDLTATENKLLCEYLHGLTPQAIAKNHKLSINTVRTHFRHIYDKLGVANFHELRRRLLSYRVR